MLIEKLIEGVAKSNNSLVRDPVQTHDLRKEGGVTTNRPPVLSKTSKDIDEASHIKN